MNMPTRLLVKDSNRAAIPAGEGEGNISGTIYQMSYFWPPKGGGGKPVLVFWIGFSGLPQGGN